MRVAAYVRVSTPGQVKLETIEQQLQSIHRYARDEGWELPEENVFRDAGYSRASLDRPALDALRDKAKIRDLDAVVVLSRTASPATTSTRWSSSRGLEKCGCRVEFVERPMSSEPDDQLLLQIRGAVAEYERTLIKERMRGKDDQAEGGALAPSDAHPYGYRADPDRPRDPDGLRLDEAKAAVVAEIFAMYLEEGRASSGCPRGSGLWVSAPPGRGGVDGVLPGSSSPTPSTRGGLRRAHAPTPAAAQALGHPSRRPALQHGGAGGPRGVDRGDHRGGHRLPAAVRPGGREKLSKNKAFASRNNKRHSYLLRALVSCGRCEPACSARALRNSRYYVCAGKKRRQQTGRGEKLPFPLRPGGATRRSGLGGPLRGPHPPRVHHRSPATGTRRRLIAAGTQGPPREPR